MFRHVVVHTFNPDTTDEQRHAVLKALRALPAAIPELVDYRVGFDLGLGVDNADFAVVADFDRVEDYRVYAEHPDHQAVLATHIRPILASRVAVQYEY